MYHKIASFYLCIDPFDGMLYVWCFNFYLSFDTGLGLLDYTTMKGYRISPHRDVIEEMFTETSSITTRLSLLHYAILHVKDLALTRQLIEIMTTEPHGCDILPMLEEFLVGTTYSGLKKQIDRSLVRYFSFTTVDVFRGLVEKVVLHIW